MKQDIKVIAMDLDGTALNHQKTAHRTNQSGDSECSKVRDPDCSSDRKNLFFAGS